MNKYLECECKTEVLHIEPQDNEYLEEGIYLSILRHAYNKDSFWHRFHHIWHTLIHGTPYVDQMCLSVDQARELKNYLAKYSHKVRVAKKKQREQNGK